MQRACVVLMVAYDIQKNMAFAGRRRVDGKSDLDIGRVPCIHKQAKRTAKTHASKGYVRSSAAQTKKKLQDRVHKKNQNRTGNRKNRKRIFKAGSVGKRRGYQRWIS